MVAEGDKVNPGDVLAKIPRETTKTKDITGGLPRVVELFEARRPKDAAVVSEISGVVHVGEATRGTRKVTVEGKEGTTREYTIPKVAHLIVQDGEWVQTGESLTDGPVDPHDVLAVLGETELQRYLVDKIQEVYRTQGVTINDKHIETIVRQMCRFVKVTDPGDTEFLLEEQVPQVPGTGGERPDREDARPAGPLRPGPARHHQGGARDRVVRLGGLVPGDHQGPHRGGGFRADRRPVRAQGERDRG